MGKIAIVGFHNLHLMQFLYKYTAILDENDIEYDVLYWNRDDVVYPQKFKGTAISFYYPTSNYISKWEKLKGYLKCRRFFVHTIKKNCYDRIILLTTQTAVALSDVALWKYRDNYVFDFRDLTMEHNSFFRFLVQKLAENAAFTAISSMGFIPFVKGKKGSFVMSHNCGNMDPIGHAHKKELPLNIVFWGMLRQEAYHRRVCDYFANDERFRLMYHGEGAVETLKEYCTQRGYQNVSFTGRYFPEEIDGFAKHTDIVMNLYENEGKQEYALTVKLYDAVKHRIPMLVMSGSYMAQYMGNRAFSYSFSFKETDKEGILKWYFGLEHLEKGFSEFSEIIAHDDGIFRAKLLDFSTL